MAFIEAFPYFSATVTDIRDEASSAKTFRLEVAAPWTFRAGQHCVIRLTGPTGYRAARDYSVSSAPSSGVIEFTVGHAFKGEVSGWLHERIRIGDVVEISKPLGEAFSWETSDTQPLLLIGGGIGIAPLISILREHRLVDADSRIAIAYSVRTQADRCFKKDLVQCRPNEIITHWYTRSTADRTSDHTGRITPEALRPLLSDNQKIYICGPTSFVDTVEHQLLDTLHVPTEHILTERFG